MSKPRHEDFKPFGTFINATKYKFQSFRTGYSQALYPNEVGFFTITSSYHECSLLHKFSRNMHVYPRLLYSSRRVRVNTSLNGLLIRRASSSSFRPAAQQPGYHRAVCLCSINNVCTHWQALTRAGGCERCLGNPHSRPMD